jgi:hypothetical protein
MGREIRRVPVDFAWPLNKTWPGFINPLHTAVKCGACEGSGASPESRRLTALWYGHEPFRPEDRGSVPFTPDDFAVRARAENNVRHSPEYYGTGQWVIGAEARRLCTHYNSQWCHHLNQDDVDALVEGGRLWDFTRDWIPGTGWTDKIPAYRPTAAEVNEWSINGFGHDSINQWIVVRAECERLGVESKCTVCGGDGELWSSEGDRAAYETWTPIDPPQGEGWQVWETVSEGSPISPVLPTDEELVWWLVTDGGYSEAGARGFVKVGHAFSLVMDSERGVRSGVEACADLMDDDS